MVSATSSATTIPTELFKKYQAAGQDHLFRHWDGLSPSERDQLVSQLEAIDIDAVLREYQTAKERLQEAKSTTSPMRPLPLDPSQIVTKGEYALGLQAIREGRLAVVTLAGGQGTRLGSTDPKGCYRIGLPSGASLFELQARRLRKLTSLAGTDAHSLPWYIMTSNATHARTEAFFRDQNYFGLPMSSVRFFKQAELPAISEEGRLFLATRSCLALSPNGNGGIYAALEREGILREMRSHGIEYVHMFCVDNALVRPADPSFVGACLAKRADCGIKSILKVDPKESVGVLCRRRLEGKDGKGEGSESGDIMVAEYSELDPEWAAMKDPTGQHLLLNQANIANHIFTVDFLERVCQREASLPAHLAHKKIPSIDLETGEPLAKAPMGYKLEYFIFDVLPWARRPLILQGERFEEFAPLKNAPGAPADSPEYCVRMVSDLHRRWLMAAGAQVGDETEPIEISPELSYAGEGLQGFKGKVVSGYLQ